MIYLEKLKQGMLYSRADWEFEKVKHTLSVQDGKFMLNVCTILPTGYSVSSTELVDFHCLLKDGWYEVKNHLAERFPLPNHLLATLASDKLFSYSIDWPTCAYRKFLNNDTV